MRCLTSCSPTPKRCGALLQHGTRSLYGSLTPALVAFVASLAALTAPTPLYLSWAQIEAKKKERMSQRDVAEVAECSFTPDLGLTRDVLESHNMGTGRYVCVRWMCVAVGFMCVFDVAGFCRVGWPCVYVLDVCDWVRTCVYVLDVGGWVWVWVLHVSPWVSRSVVTLRESVVYVETSGGGGRVAISIPPITT